MSGVLEWLRLQRGLGFGANTRVLLEYFGSAHDFFAAGEDEWRVSGVFGRGKFETSPGCISRFAEIPPEYGEKIAADCEKEGIEILTPDSEQYPKRLLRIVNFPVALFVKGDASCLDDELAVGVVGTRKPSEYGIAAAKKIAGDLCENGALIVSGGALGIDSVSHNCALERGKKTVLVLGCPHDSNYLKENAALREAVSRNGALVSEYPPGIHTSPFFFTLRNRIISGLSRGVVVVEAGEKSGSLNTANHAFSQGRDVFAVPGDISSKSYFGSNAILQRGAKPVFSAADVLSFYAVEAKALSEAEQAFESPPFFGIDSYPYGEPEEKPKKAARNAKRNKKIQPEPIKNEKNSNFDPKTVSNNAQLVYNLLLSGKAELDEITRESGLPVRRVLAALTELEIASAACSLGGNRFEAR